MANTILTTDVIAGEALDVLRNNAVMPNLVHRDYSGDFVPRSSQAPRPRRTRPSRASTSPWTSTST